MFTLKADPYVNRVLAVALMLAGVTARAAQVQLNPAADTTIFELDPNNNMGGSTTLIAGANNNGNRARALLKFDPSHAIPSGSVISSVSLTLIVVKAPATGVPSKFDLHRVLLAWGEGNKSGQSGSAASDGEATWINRLAPSTAWSSPGGAAPGDFSDTVSAATMVFGPATYTFTSTTSLVADVQAWVDNPSSNFGWLLISESESTAATARRIGSREDSVNAAVLTITFSAPTTQPPQITAQPQSQTVDAGATVSFRVAAGGTAPLSYQWQFNGANLAGASGASLTLTNAQAAKAGTYTVIVTNPAGSVTSAPATLTVNAVVIRLTAITVSGGQVSISYSGTSGPVQLQKKASLSDANWQNAGGAITGNLVTDTVTGGRGFYRLIVP